MTTQKRIASAYTSVGMVTRTRSSSGAKWMMAGIVDTDRAFNGSLKSLRKLVLAKYGEEVEKEVIEAAKAIKEANR